MNSDIDLYDVFLSLLVGSLLAYLALHSTGCASVESEHRQRPVYTLVTHDMTAPYSQRFCAKSLTRIVCADTNGACEKVRIYEHVTTRCELQRASR